MARRKKDRIKPIYWAIDISEDKLLKNWDKHIYWISDISGRDLLKFDWTVSEKNVNAKF